MGKLLIKGTPWYIHTIMAISILLVIVSFFIPPTGVIEGSVLAAIGELGGLGAIFNVITHIPEYLEAGHKAEIKYGGASISIEKDDDNNKEESFEEEIDEEP